MSYDDACGLCGVLGDEHSRGSCPEFVSSAPSSLHKALRTWREAKAREPRPSDADVALVIVLDALAKTGGL